jgi:hypothetical protein
MVRTEKDSSGVFSGPRGCGVLPSPERKKRV